jgi:hypothetical protein
VKGGRKGGRKGRKEEEKRGFRVMMAKGNFKADWD